MADVTIAFLSRCIIQSNIDEKVELRIYKKPQKLPDGQYAVAEYRDISPSLMKERRKKLAKTDQANSKNETLADDFVVIVAGELLDDEEADCVANWVRFHDVVKNWRMWWKYCVAVHKRIGWKVNLERSMLNMMDSRVFGFVTVTVEKFAK